MRHLVNLRGPAWALCAILLLGLAGCGGSEAADGGGDSPHSAGAAGERRGEGGGSPGGGSWGGGGFGAEETRAAVPVEVAPVVRRAISSYIETNGTLEAENDVDLVARTSGPVVELLVEEGMQVREGQLLARLDQDQVRAQLEISRVAFEEAKLAYQRAKKLWEDELLSREGHDQALSAYESAQAQLLGNEILLDYTEIRAPFSGLISRRYIKFAQSVSTNERLFRLTDFDPLLCPIQVPERELPLLRVGQSAYLTVEAWAGERLPARVLRISPVIDAATGTVRVTLEVETGGRLRPGMFASVYLETETRPEALVIPKAALALESIGDTVYVADGEIASRREVRLGFTEGASVEILEGVREGEQVVVVGQDGLSDGTPIEVLGVQGAPGPAEASPPRFASGGAPAGAATRGAGEAPPASASGGPGGAPGSAPAFGARGGGFGGRPPFDPSQLTGEQLERIKQRMRERGLTDEQIEERLKQMRERAGG